MSITIDDELAQNALLAASAAGSKDLVIGLIKAGVKAGSTYGAALVIAEFNGHAELANILRSQMNKENAPIPHWQSPDFSIPNN